MADLDRTLRFSRTELLCLFGIALFVLSLLLPAAKMGSGSTTGLSWFVLGTLTAFSPQRGEAANLSAIAVLLNLSCLLTFVAVFNRWKSRSVIVWTVCIGACCAMVLWFRPYSHFERVYLGYHLWIASAIWILLTPIVSEKLGWETPVAG